MKLIILGSNGQLGKSFQDVLSGSSECYFLNRQDYDIDKITELRRTLEAYAPQAIINCIAYTNVDEAEVDHVTAYKVNATLPYELSLISNELGCKLVHFSTDYVFGGDDVNPYSELDSVSPLSVYGKSKLEGEKIITEITNDYLIFRTSWVFSEYGNNFLKTMASLYLSKGNIKVVDDQVGCPTYAKSLASDVIKILKKLIMKKTRSIYHLSGSDSVSWYHFSKMIFENIESSSSSRILPVKTINRKEYAKRPVNSVLNCSKAQEEFALDKHALSEDIKAALKRIKTI